MPSFESLMYHSLDTQTAKFKLPAYRSKTIQPYQTVNFDLHELLFSHNVFCMFIIYFTFRRGSGDTTSTCIFDIRPGVILSLSLFDRFGNYNKNQYFTRENHQFCYKG